MDAVYAIYEPILDSQAGRHGFESRLPLQSFQWLTGNPGLVQLVQNASLKSWHSAFGEASEIEELCGVPTCWHTLTDP